MMDVVTLIDAIDDLTMESEIAVIGSLGRVYAKQAQMLLQCEDLDALDAVFSEADTPVEPQADANANKPTPAKSGGLRKMIEAVKKFLALVARCIKVVINAIANIFRRKGRGKKTMEQILAECGFGQRAESNKVDEAFDKYVIAFKTDDVFVVKDRKFVGDKAERKAGGAKIHKLSPHNPEAAIVLILNDKYRADFFGYIRTFLSYLNDLKSTGTFETKKWNVVREKMIEVSPEGAYEEAEISYKKLTEIQGELNVLQKEFDTFNYMEFDNILNRMNSQDRSRAELFVGKAMGYLTTSLNIVQMSFNGLANRIIHVFDLPTSYYGTVTTPDALATFAKNCVESGIPPRYVVHAVVKITSDDMKGKKQPLGQSRVVLFPKNDPSNVYKVAYNGFGISSNKAEIAVSKFIADHKPSEPLVTPVTSVYDDGYVIAMARANGKRPNNQQLESVIKKFETFASSSGWSVTTADLHHDNVSQLASGEWVAIDYGWSPRK